MALSEVIFVCLAILIPVFFVLLSIVAQSSSLTSKAQLLLEIGLLYWFIILLPIIYGLIIEFIYPQKNNIPL